MSTSSELRAYSRITRFLLPGERVLYSCRQHWLSTVPQAWRTRRLLLVLLILSLLAALAVHRTPRGFGAAILTGVAVWLFSDVVEWLSTRFVVTDRRVMLVTEPLPVNVRFIALSRVTSVSFSQSLTGRMFGYGTFGIDNAGDSHPLHDLKYTRRTGELYDVLSQELFSDGLPKDPEDGPSAHRTRPVPRLPPSQLS